MEQIQVLNGENDSRESILWPRIKGKIAHVREDQHAKRKHYHVWLLLKFKED